MLNKNGERELAYVATITDKKLIEGYDRICVYYVNGWTCVGGKDEFEVGDKCVFIEPDALCPYTDVFKFLDESIDEHTGKKRADRHKIKVQKFCKGQAISAGLIVPLKAAGVKDTLEVGEFLTKDLGITYWEKEDNTRKANISKYTSMQARHKKFFKTKLGKWLMKREWGRKLCFFFLGKKKDKKTDWPSWVVKTDEERVQNMPWILNDKSPWIATEKIDGSSTTFTMKRGKKRLFGQDKNEFYVCSRNVVFDKPDKQCFYPTNIYVEMAEKYKVEAALTTYLGLHPDVEWVTIQGETYGEGIQKRDYSLKGHDFMAFNLIDSVRGRWNSVEAKNVCSTYGIPWVPILDENFILPDTVDELLTIATGESICDHGMREGLVLRSQDGARSFKAVSNEFLLKYHNG